MTSYLSKCFQTVSVEGELSLPVLMEYSVPQGSVLGLKNYVLYTKPLGDVIRRHGLQHHFYVDDTQLYLSFKPKDDVIQAEALTRIENCLIEIEAWMHQSMLKLNNEITEVMLFTSKHNSQFMDKVSVQVGNARITSTICVHNQGVMFDSNMTMTQQVTSICRSGYAQLHSIGRIRRYLSNDATMISKLQHVQNMANQICGVQKLISGTGEVQATAVNQLLEDWGVQHLIRALWRSF